MISNMVQLLFLIIHTLLMFRMNSDNLENPQTLRWMRFSAYSKLCHCQGNLTAH
jgi:hypothetical protein